MDAQYDTKEGINSYLKDGLPGLRRLVADRGEAGYKRKERMREWVVLGRYRLDTCGNFMGIIDGAPDDQHYEPFDQVMTMDEAVKISPHFTSTFANLPSSDDRCPRCEEGWQLRNCYDLEKVGERLFHKKCAEYERHETVRAKMSSLFDDAGLVAKELKAIPNGYGSYWNGPWFFVITDIGKIKIGWRKNVIEISWPDWIGVNGAELFGSENVTKGAAYIHAWGYEKATEYLRRLREAVGNKRNASAVVFP